MAANLQKLMKQAQQMQAKMNQLQEELTEKTMEASVGGGMVTVTVNGKHELLDVQIQKEAVDPDDVEMLQDLIIAAVNEAMVKMDTHVAEEMAKITGGMKMPGLF